MIKVRDLAASYGDNVVLEGISLDVEPEEILVIMGQSGCGKSTFLRHLIGLQKPLSGSVEVDGRDVTKMSEADYRSYCRSVGVLFQSGGLFNSMTIGENVAFPLREHTRLADPVIDIVVKLKLAQVGLRGVEGLMPSELSGGMKKRAGLARALALDPTILFLDEPTTGLDPIIAAGIDESILHLREMYRATMVVVAHDIASSMRIADRIAIFRENALTGLGTPEEIQNSDDPYVQQFLERQPPEEEAEGELAAYLL
ncbi:MAG: ABC transporter ATP-binding protein [Candidatus Brocadiia bacterium]